MQDKDPSSQTIPCEEAFGGGGKEEFPFNRKRVLIYAQRGTAISLELLGDESESKERLHTRTNDVL